MKQGKEIVELVLHLRVAVILLDDLERLRKPEPREAVTWFPNQWVAAMDLESRSYFPARGEGH